MCGVNALWRGEAELMLSSPSHAARIESNISRWHHSARPTMNFSHHHRHEYPWPAPSALLHSVHAALAATALEPEVSDTKLAAKSTVRIATLNVLNCHLVGLVARPAEVLDAAVRLRLLLDTFGTLAASDTVVALQEVPLGWLSALRRHARKLGYRLVATFSKLARGVPGFMGVALAWPARAYDATAVDARQLHEAVGWPRQPSPPRDAAWTNMRSAVSAVVAARLRQRGGAGAAFVAASVHLPYDGRLGALLRPTQGVAAAIAARHVAALANRSGATLPHALLDDLRRDADDSVVLVNVLRYVADRWTGHWQPVGGYSELSDDEAFVLLLDPARHKCVWHWVPLRLVVGCVCTTNSRGEARGYLRLARG